MKTHACGVAAALALAVAAPASHALTLYGPTPYTSFNDSPFFGMVALENFEGAPILGYTALNGSPLGPGALTDSVDGANPGAGSIGTSWYSGLNGVGSNSIGFSFTGPLPTKVGLVWTDVGFTDSGSIGGPSQVFLDVYDAGGALAGTLDMGLLGDALASGETAEDRFGGAFLAGGISKIVMRMPQSDDWEVDHLQFGAPVPEPSTYALMGVGLLGVASAVARKRRR
ncbi:MAG: PEP-CTERM sorting domain-containing protein [Burkholderiales bacterium]|jgi:hypothetical protein|nr:PEP-CTERM sorting domain-containing protein [Burkholderiales bacterium]